MVVGAVRHYRGTYMNIRIFDDDEMAYRVPIEPESEEFGSAVPYPYAEAFGHIDPDREIKLTDALLMALERERDADAEIARLKAVIEEADSQILLLESLVGKKGKQVQAEMQQEGRINLGSPGETIVVTHRGEKPQTYRIQDVRVSLSPLGHMLVGQHMPYMQTLELTLVSYPDA